MKMTPLLRCTLLAAALLSCSTGDKAEEVRDAGPSPVDSEPITAVEPSDGTAETKDEPVAMHDATPPTEDGPTPEPGLSEPAEEAAPTIETATLGAGCFWCMEAVLEQIEGVTAVRSGYMGGHMDNPTYKQVCAEITGHAEVVQVDFDPSVISYGEVLHWFWRLHDPTTLNRQGADVGTQYRSAIYVHSPEQRATAERSLQLAQAEFTSPIVTEVTEASTFWEAEGYHQGYYLDNKTQSYCRMVIRPKLKKLGLDY